MLMCSESEAMKHGTIVSARQIQAPGIPLEGRRRQKANPTPDDSGTTFETDRGSQSKIEGTMLAKREWKRPHTAPRDLSQSDRLIGHGGHWEHG